MVKKSTLSKKLAAYSTLATAVLVVSHEAEGQIIYTDLNPEVIIPTSVMYRSDYNASAYLDLNNDGTSDYQFTASGGYRILTSNTFGSSYASSASIKGSGLNNNLINRVVAPSGNLIPTNVPNSWTANLQMAKEFATYRVSFGSIIRSTFSGFGPFYGVSSVYAALKFSNNGNTYYGWARVYTVQARQFAIADYAYNATPNTPIVAGNTGCNFAPITPTIIVKNDTLESTNAKKYQWYFDGAPVSGDTLPVLTHTQQGYYAVLTTDLNGCLSESQAKYFSCYSVKPVISEVSGFTNPSCDSAQLRQVNLVNGTSIQWLRNGDTIAGATSPTYWADSSGSYSAEFIDSGKTCYLISDTIMLGVDMEHPTINLVDNDTLMTQHYTSYVWYANGVPTSDTDQDYIPTANGTYFVVVTDSLGCLFKSPDYDFTATGITPVAQTDVSIYAYDRRLHVLFTDENLIGSPLKMYNTLGQQVFATTLTTEQTEIDMTNFAPGLYVVEVAGKAAPFIKKIVIE